MRHGLNLTLGTCKDHSCFKFIDEVKASSLSGQSAGDVNVGPRFGLERNTSAAS